MSKPLLPWLLCLALVPTSAAGQEVGPTDPPPRAPTRDDGARQPEDEVDEDEDAAEWEALVAAHVYFPLIGRGEVEVDGVTSRPEDLAAGLVALGARVQIESPWRLGLVVDVYNTPSDYELGGEVRAVEIDGARYTVTLDEAEIERFNTDVLLSFRALQVDLAKVVEVGLAFEVGVGWVHYRNQLDLGLDGLPVSLVEREDAFELLLGVDLEVELLGGLFGVILQGDLGGFGIGEASELSWKLVALLRVRPISLLSLDVGYRGLSVEYAGAGGDRIELEAVSHGVMLAANLHF